MLNLNGLDLRLRHLTLTDHFGLGEAAAREGCGVDGEQINVRREVK